MAAPLDAEKYFCTAYLIVKALASHAIVQLHAKECRARRRMCSYSEHPLSRTALGAPSHMYVEALRFFAPVSRVR